MPAAWTTLDFDAAKTSFERQVHRELRHNRTGSGGVMVAILNGRTFKRELVSMRNNKVKVASHIGHHLISELV